MRTVAVIAGVVISAYGAYVFIRLSLGSDGNTDHDLRPIERIERWLARKRALDHGPDGEAGDVTGLNDPETH